MPGPVGLQLEPTTDSELRYVAKVARFVDGGPKNPGQARKSGAIRPGDFIILAESASLIGRTYKTIIQVLEMSHAVREITYFSPWESISPKEVPHSLTENALTQDCQKPCESNTVNQLRPTSVDDQQSDHSPSNKDSGQQGPMIFHLHDSRILEENFNFKLDVSCDDPKATMRDAPETLTEQTQQFISSSDDPHNSQKEDAVNTPSRPPRSRFAVDTPVQQSHAMSICGTTVTLRQFQNHPGEDNTFSYPKLGRSNQVLRVWNDQTKNLSEALHLARGSLIPAVVDSLAKRIAPSIGSKFIASNLASRKPERQPSDEVCQHQSDATSFPRLTGTTNLDWRESVDQLFNENLTIRRNFEEKLQLARAEHVSTNTILNSNTHLFPCTQHFRSVITRQKQSAT